MLQFLLGFLWWSCDPFPSTSVSSSHLHPLVPTISSWSQLTLSLQHKNINISNVQCACLCSYWKLQIVGYYAGSQLWEKYVCIIVRFNFPFEHNSFAVDLNKFLWEMCFASVLNLKTSQLSFHSRVILQSQVSAGWTWCWEHLITVSRCSLPEKINMAWQCVCSGLSYISCFNLDQG